jgi:hypothetical protein
MHYAVGSLCSLVAGRVLVGLMLCGFVFSRHTSIEQNGSLGNKESKTWQR